MAPYLPELPALAAVFSVAAITPGPDFLAVSHTTLTRSRRDGAYAALGVTPGMACWALAAPAGFAGITWAWYTGLALAFSLPRISALYELSRRGVERVCGGLFLFLGVRFAAGD